MQERARAGSGLSRAELASLRPLRPDAVAARATAWAARSAIFVAADSPGRVPKRQIQRGSDPERNSFRARADIVPAFRDSALGWRNSQRGTRADRAALPRYSAAGDRQAAPAGRLQPQPADGRPARRMAPDAAVGRAGRNGRKHPPRHGFPPPARASEPPLPARHAPTAVRPASKSIAQAPPRNECHWPTPAAGGRIPGTGIRPGCARRRLPPAGEGLPGVESRINRPREFRDIRARWGGEIPALFCFVAGGAEGSSVGGRRHRVADTGGGGRKDYCRKEEGGEDRWPGHR